MTNSELITELVKEVVEKRGYAFATGYLESMLKQVVDGCNKRHQSEIHSDLVWHLKKQQEIA